MEISQKTRNTCDTQQKMQNGVVYYKESEFTTIIKVLVELSWFTVINGRKVFFTIQCPDCNSQNYKSSYIVLINHG